MIEKKYHIYVKNKCIYHSLSESEFSEIWTMLNNFIEVASEINKNDLQYEEVVLQKEIIINSSH